MGTVLSQLKEKIGTDAIQEHVQLGLYATMKVGGPAEYFFTATTEEELINAVKAAHELGMPIHVFGGISNVLISQEGLKGLVVRNMVATKDVLEETDEHVILRVGSGHNMSRLAKETAEAGWEGLEYHLGLPGTVGGGIALNSGWYGHKPDKYIGDPLVQAKLVRVDGTTYIAQKEYFKFVYDYSILKDTHEILVWADFKLVKGDPEELKSHGTEALEYRKKTQPFGMPTSGCFFQNVEGESVGKIIDELGLKGYTIGGAQVSTKHANFIENTGDATSDDVAQLVTYIKTKVREERGIELENEVICL